GLLALVLPCRRPQRDLPGPRGPVLRGRRPRSAAVADVPRGGSGGRHGASADVPRAVLGRPEGLRREARPPPATHASRPVSGLPRRVGIVASALERGAGR